MPDTPPQPDSSPRSPSAFAAVRVAAVFSLAGLIWIATSDVLLASAGEMSGYGLRVAVAKGAAFVLLTAGLVFWLVRRELRTAARGADMLRAIAEGTDDAVFVKDRAGRYLLFNAAAARLVGKPAAAVLGRTDAAVFDPAGAELVMARDRRVMRTGRAEVEEETLTAGGVTRTYLSTKAPYRDDTGAVVGVVGVSRDVTEARRAEAALRESERRFRDLADAAPVLIWLSDTTRGCVWFNRRWLEFVGRPLEAEVGAGWAEGVHPDDRDRCVRSYDAAFDAREPFVMEYRLRRHDGEYRWVLDTGAPRTSGGAFAGYIGSCVDITDRKRAEDALRDSEARYRTLVDNASDGVLLHAADGTIIDANPAAGRALGLSRGELIGAAPLAFDPTATPDRMGAILAALDAGTPLAFDTVHRRKDGSTFPAEVRLRPFWAGGQRLSISTIRDITDRKRAEDALRASEARLAEAQRVARLGSWAWDPASGRVWWSDTVFELLGLSPETVSPSLDAFLDSLHPDDRPRARARAQAMLAGGTEFADDLRVVRPDGTVLWVHSRARVTRDAAGRVTRVEGTDQDITDRKRAEEQLRASQERLRLALDAAQLGVWEVLLPDGANHPARVNNWEEAYGRLFGLSPDQLPRAEEEFFALVHPEDRAAVAAAFERCAAGEADYVCEFRVLRPDGRPCWHASSGRLLRAPAGGQDRVIGVGRDVTDRKQAEEALRASEERLRLALAVGGLGTWDLDLRTGRVVWSDDHYAMHGYAPGEVPPSYQAWLDRVHPDDRPAAEAAMADARDARGPFAFDFRALHPDGSVRWLSARGRYFYDEAGTPVRMVGVGRDVTGQRDAERELRLARFSVERAVEAIFWIAPSGEIQYANAAAHRALGYAPGELAGKTVPDIDPNFPAAAWPAHWEEVKRRGSFSFESEHRTKGGRPILTEVTVNYLRHEDREYNCAVMRDVTDRKRAEEELRRSEDKLRTIFENEPECVKLLDRAGRLLEMNPAGLRMIEADSIDAVRGAAVTELLNEPDRPRFAEMLAGVFRGESRTLAFEIRGLAGTPRVLETHSVPLWDADRQGVQALLGVTRDVTDRKRAETALRASEERLRLALLAGRMGTFDWDLRTGRVVWSDTHFDLWGYPPGDRPAVGYDTFLSRVHPEDRAAVEATVDHSRRARGLYQHEYRVVLPSGEVRWIAGRGEFQYAAGEPVRMLGTVQDITARKLAEQALAESERRYRELADAIPQIVWTADRDGGLTHLNAKATEYTGLPAGDLTGWSWDVVIHPDDLPALVREWGETIRTGTPRLIEFRIRRADGAYRWHLSRQTPALSPAGERLGWYGTITDVEDLKAAEAAVRAGEERLAQAVLVAGAGVFDHDHLTGANYWSPRLREIYGYSPTAPARLDAYLAMIHPDDAAAIAAAVRRAHDPTGDGRFDVEHRLVRPADGAVRWLATRSRTAFAGEGADRRPVRTIGAVLDVTAAREAEQVMRESEERYRRLVELLPVGVFVRTGDRVTYANPAYARMVGAADGAALLGRPAADALHPDSRPRVAAVIDEMRATGRAGRPLEVQARRLDGTYYPAYTIAMPLGGAGEVLVVVVDTSERERADRLMQSLLASVGDAILTVDARGTVWLANPATERLFGYPVAELVGRNVSTLMPEPFRGEHDRYLADYLRTGAAKVIGVGREVVGRRKDGSEFPIELTVTELRLGDERHFTGVVRDVTARKRLEEQFRQSQKMEAVGRLAGGVAHDFNNLLTVINGYTDLLLDEFPADHPQGAAVAAVRDAGERAASLTSQLLAFSRRTIVAPKLFDLRDVVTQAEKLLRRLIGEDVTLHVVFSAAPCRVHADPGQIDQVIMNLAVNARDAMPTGGRLTLETRPVAVGEAGGAGGAAPGRYVELTVSDTGCGMTDEVMANIFEPFFTTKEAGKGTGLGLATVYGIVEQAGGRVTVSSRVGHGTTFRVLLPAAAAPAPEAETRAVAAAGRGTETVLLVEDDDAVRGLCTLALESQGYTVLAAPSGREALELLRGRTGGVRLMVTDVVMPGMSGRELADEAAHLAPDLKVLFVSGYTDDAVFRHGVRDAADHFLQKPFSPLALARKVREILDRR